MIKLIKKIILLIKSFLLIRDFKKKNRKIFHNSDKKVNKKILLEFNSNDLSIIANSFFVNYLKKKYNAQIISYLFVFDFYYFHKIKLKVLEFFDYKYFGIFKSFGVNKFIINTDSKKFSKKVDSNLKDIFSKIKDKKDILKIRINKILIGDLLYDSYLRLYNKPTIKLSDQQFINFTKKFLELFFYWEDYISKNKKDIESIVVSHCVYYTAIPLRICINNNIDSFQVNVHGIHKLNQKELFSYSEFKNYPKIFKSLDDKNKNTYLEKAKNRVKLRLSGTGADITYSKKTAYGNISKKRLIKKSPNIKVLIAAHCFSDSPHPFGENLFVDFYEWIHFLGNISNKTKYDWYIKTHPDFIQSTKDTIIEFTKKYPKLKLLPSTASHNQIISEGIKFALTCYGTIGHEYAALNKIVINASLKNPHIAYKFNMHPKNIEEYEKILLNLKKVKLKIDKKEIYEFYYMRYLYSADNWLLDNYKLLENKIGYKTFSTPIIYKYWLEQLDEKKIDKINENIKNFINSKNYNLSPKHIN